MRPPRLHLGEVAHAPQQPVGDARRAARTRRDLRGALDVDRHAEDAGRSLHDALQFVVAVELEPLHDAEAIAQRRRQQARARRGADQRERRQVDLDRARARALADHDVELEVLERRVEDFLDHRAQAVDLVDEQDVVRLQVGEQRREVARPLEHRPRGLLEADAELVRDDVRERGLAEARRAEDQHVIERLAAVARGRDEDLHLRLHGRLADVVGERLRPHRAVVDLFLALAAGGDRRGRVRSSRAVLARCGISRCRAQRVADQFFGGGRGRDRPSAAGA